MIKVFDEEYQEQGVATRDEVHNKGLWHETFHCWLVSQEMNKYYIYLQKRSSMKKDFPNLLDITAAGHLLECETVEDGIREVEEELGIKVSYEDLISLGVIKDRLVTDKIKDNELTNVFLLKWTGKMEDFQVQKEEVSGIFKAELEPFVNLWSGKTDKILVEGFNMQQDHSKEEIRKKVGKEDFVPHETSYMKSLVSMFRSL